MNQSEVKELLDYNPETGIFTWKKSNRNLSMTTGTVAGTIINKSYIGIRIKNKRYFAHRLAWLYIYGSWPKNNIDHINGDGLDNRIKNLRDIKQRYNTLNKYRHRNGQLAGIRYHKRDKIYEAYIQIDGKKKYLGRSKNKLEAHEIYMKALSKLSQY